MAENEDEAAGADEAASTESTAPTGPFLRDFNTLTDGFPRVSPRSALVQFYRNGGYTVKRASGVRHVDKPVLARPHSICEIALGTYVTPLQMELPAAGATTFFKAEVDIEWSVTDPHLAALEVVTDVANRLTSPILERLREVTTTYRVTEAEQANRAITRECAGGRWADLGSELGLRVRLYVRLRVDDRTIEHADEERDAHAQAKVIRLRQESYRRMLMGGELEQLSFMLAADPEGAKDFLEQIRQEGRQDEKERVARLFTMATRGELATVDVETQVLNLLNQGTGRPMVGPIGTVPARRTRELEASADRPFNPDWASDEPPRRPPHRAQPSRGEGDGRGADGRVSDRRGSGRRTSDRDRPYPGDDADHDEPGTRGRRRTDAYDPRDDAEFDEPRGARQRTYRPEPYSPGPAPETDYDDDPRFRDARRAYRPEPYPAGPAPDEDDDPRFRDRRQAHRPEPYHPDEGADYDDRRPGARRRPGRPELDPAGPDRDRDDEPRSAGRPRTYRPEPYYPDGGPDRESPRRRRRAEDDGWSWAEEDR
ncbi:hypothetical protein [Streptomyces sp. NPDC056464]|uniref:hypothetical protein n=1 Tax=Streptomyces sp. NPDC056464 TaxID=3345828 RepID=UPI0036B6B8B6